MNRRDFLALGGFISSGLILGSPYLQAANVDNPDMLLTETVSQNFGNVTVHAIPAGLVKVKRSHKNPSPGFPVILFDPFWTDWMPIYTWVIEHPEGIILIDTGENTQVRRKEYFGCDKINGFIYRSILKLDIDADQELPYQLQKLGIYPEDIRWVVLTHLHLDHVDGAHFFPKSEFIISKTEYKHPPAGYVPCLMPDWLKPRLVDFSKTEVNGFDGSFSLTDAMDIVLIPTPGHTHGHMSVILQTANEDILFAGDTTFSQEQLIEDKVAGICSDKKQAKKTLEQIRNHGLNKSVIYLPSHDPNSAKRLLKKEYLNIFG